VIPTQINLIADSGSESSEVGQLVVKVASGSTPLTDRLVNVPQQTRNRYSYVVDGDF
jgi:hypothetical protein